MLQYKIWIQKSVAIALLRVTACEPNQLIQDSLVKQVRNESVRAPAFAALVMRITNCTPHSYGISRWGMPRPNPLNSRKAAFKGSANAQGKGAPFRDCWGPLFSCLQLLLTEREGRRAAKSSSSIACLMDVLQVKRHGTVGSYCKWYHPQSARFCKTRSKLCDSASALETNEHYPSN
jgi:hypothetical protein